ncbi:hypothetical protein IGI04_005927 [Brassica rapa subsp. trilocularis]|uniref:Uncharacterized protein n=1 Tax=Brassica rapa subsp. trilocularis TaxID=1813537 RepID=A0ABQ7NFD1_BRACM|nr:hypothetical protein IGI04_005927 [Brassica rapa subsp. trilocularis]
MSRPVKITETIKINGDKDLAVQGCSCFASSPRNNELFKESIDVSHDEALIAHHEPLTPTPKKLSQDEPVSGKPPPLRDKNLEDKVLWRLENQKFSFVRQTLKNHS